MNRRKSGLTFDELMEDINKVTYELDTSDKVTSLTNELMYTKVQLDQAHVDNDVLTLIIKILFVGIIILALFI